MKEKAKTAIVGPVRATRSTAIGSATRAVAAYEQLLAAIGNRAAKIPGQVVTYCLTSAALTEGS
jgi:hypothetical protein